MTDWLEVKAHISQAYWCMLETVEGASFKKATREESEIAWLDEMFCGAIRFPKDKNRPATILVTGPPGSGKTALALELCYRLADTQITEDSPVGNKKEPWLCLYLSAEMTENQMREKAAAFGWERATDRFYGGSGVLRPQNQDHGTVILRGAESVQSKGIADAITEVLNDGLDVLRSMPVTGATAAAEGAHRALEYFHRWATDDARWQMKRVSPDLVVVDSLNSIDDEDRKDYFRSFLSIAGKKALVLVFVLDSNTDEGQHEFWEYMCDCVIRLDCDRSSRDYFLRSLEIVKARYQEHTLGKQQMKIYPWRCQSCNKVDATCERKPDKCRRTRDDREMRRAHPYRHEGGIFLYPSIHYYLSRYKRRGTEDKPIPVETWPDTLNNLVRHTAGERGLFSQGRCAALIGRRGAHKSHLGYLHLLRRMIKDEETSLVVSLRDDEEMTRKSILTILEQEQELRDCQQANELIDGLLRQDRLEILYFPPGYITPEEFYHRLFMSVYRLKRLYPHRKLTVLFNSLDQLSARFPLCADQSIFVPGIIASLCGENVTSIFVAVQETNELEQQQYGLIPMADVVLSFDRRTIRENDYSSLMNGDTTAPRTQSRQSRRADMKSVVTLEVLRSAGGEMAGSKGILELVTHAGNSPLGKTGLHFIAVPRGFTPELQRESREDI